MTLTVIRTGAGPVPPPPTLLPWTEQNAVGRREETPVWPLLRQFRVRELHSGQRLVATIRRSILELLRASARREVSLFMASEKIISSD